MHHRKGKKHIKAVNEMVKNNNNDCKKNKAEFSEE